MGFDLHLSRARKALKPRKAPYWDLLQRGSYIGLRVLDGGRASWSARLYNDTAHKYQYRALGFLTPEFGFDEARAAALDFFREHTGGISTARLTVEDAAKDYIKDRQAESPGRTTRDAETRLERTVYGTAFGKTPVTRLTTPAIVQWRANLSTSAADRTRTWTVVRAALNLAVRMRRVPLTLAREWNEVMALPERGGRRDLFLDLAQRRAWVEAATGTVRYLIEAACLTGARSGELLGAKRGQFDGRTQTMTFSGKTGPRTVPLSPAAVALFTRIADGKKPTDALFPSPSGTAWTGFNYAEPVKKAAQRAGLPPGATLYTLRHSFVTQAITDGLSTLDVAKLTGTSLMMIERHYGQFVLGAVRERLAKVTML